MKRWTTWVALALALLLAGCTVSAGYPYYARPYPPPAYGDWRWDDDLSLLDILRPLETWIFSPAPLRKRHRNASPFRP